MRLCLLFFLFNVQCSMFNVFAQQAQIYIGGNVYGGGNQGDVNGSTKVTMKAGDVHGKVFGGARMADVSGSAYVHIDGEHATDNMIINFVYGGNDIAGSIGSYETVGQTLPPELAEEATTYSYTTAWNAFVRVSTKMTKYTAEEAAAYNTAHGLNEGDPGYKTTADDKDEAADAKKTFIGQLFAGGNGDYYYETTTSGGKTTHKIYQRAGDEFPIASKVTDEGGEGYSKPDLANTFIDIHGATIGYIYGGGNNATVTENAIICMDNPSTVVTQIEDKDGNPILTSERVYGTNEMALQDGGYVQVSSDEYLAARLFGGNNKADMAIRPEWHLERGSVRDIYSGGNKGRMINENGILLEVPSDSEIKADNIYGGCRMADVRPMKWNESLGEYEDVKEVDNIFGYYFPRNLAARLLIQGGDINNVYGGNDIRGKVYFGNAVGVSTSIHGDIYGGGNGAYPYTDDPNLEEDPTYGDYYYSSGTPNDQRPNAEQVSVMVRGTEGKPTIIGGSIYCGGNCATLVKDPAHANLKNYPLVELKIGSHVIADNVFLGNNGEKMVDETMLKHYAGKIDEYPNFSTLDLTDPDRFAEYMQGAALDIRPRLVFEDMAKGDRTTYEDYTSYIGSFFCGGNVGSMTYEGKNPMKFDAPIIVYNKVVGGCNNANVAASDINAAYYGGILGTPEEQEEDGFKENGKIKDRLEMTFSGLRIQPKRLNSTRTGLEWNTAKFSEIYEAVEAGSTLESGKKYYTSDAGTGEFTSDGTEVADGTNYFEKSYDYVNIGTTDAAEDNERRLLHGNVYGGCYNSGHVNGNVVINIDQDLIKKSDIFGAGKSEVSYEKQRDDVMDIAMTVFGAGYGEDTEIWGSTTINLNKGYTFQAFGGGEEGVVGKKNSSGEYAYNADYSSTVNLKGTKTIYSSEGTDPDIPEAEYLYGGGNEGDICGDTYVNLGNGRIYDAFGGASNATIYGHTEVYIGKNGFPWIRDNVYGGNDFGGFIRNKKNYAAETTREVWDSSLLESATYVRYIQGRVDTIFGGCYGEYDYTDPIFVNYTYVRGEEQNLPDGVNLGDPKGSFHFPHLDSGSFVHFTPENNTENKVGIIFGSSEGYPGDYSMNNAMQGESYVLIDDTKTEDATQFANVDVYGGGAYAGVGSEQALGAGRTVVDLFAGSVNNVYGGSNREALIGTTRVNVPSVSTIRANALYGGSKGYAPELIEANPALSSRYCDTYVTCIDYQSENAIVENGIYGGNRNCRIAYDTYINVGAPVKQSNGYDGTIYGAGYGAKTASGRTNIYMNSGSNAYKVFGGGRDGNVHNFASMTHWLGLQFANEYDHSLTGAAAETAATAAAAAAPGKVKDYGAFLTGFRTYVGEPGRVSLPSPIPTYTDDIWKIETVGGVPTLVDAKTHYNTNVHLMPGSNVSGYAYGGGFGSNAVVSGTTYVELKGGNVERDIYGGGQGGPVYDEFSFAKDGVEDHKDFVATTNVLIESGMVRNVYGGGYLGHVGKHDGDISASNANDIPGVANVIIGKTGGTSFSDGIPAIMRNAYGGGEGGSVYGTANVTMNNGYIGYRYKNTGTEVAPVYQYEEELDDQKPNSIELAGNLFGGGYVVNSYVDNANVEMYGGTIRGSLYGGGEVGPIGRGTMKADATTANGGIKNGPTDSQATIYKAGKTHVKMFNGHVLRNVFGGGRGKDSWGGDGTLYMDEAIKPTLDLECKGYVFGQTEVDIFGGEIGTEEGMARNFGNVFGGGDEGSVYSAYENESGTLCIGKKAGIRYNEGLEETDPEYHYQGYYYKYEGGEFITHNVAAANEPEKMERSFTEDCKVLVEPWLQVKNSAIEYGGKTYAVGDYIPTAYLNTLKAKGKDDATWPAGWDNVDVGSSVEENNETVFKERGITIHNAVFAGGNIAAGSSALYVNAKTVYGNATASIHDVYNRDLITIGTGHTGGLYGDGNLTFVDGYRELNITNYGSDYFHIMPTLTIEQYKVLPEREKAYYELKYRCKADLNSPDIEGTTYKEGAKLPYDELLALFTNPNGTSVQENGVDIIITQNGKKVPNPAYWEENGVVSAYAGRIMNTIQRADLCGVFGSRMVMKGAQDRVPETVDYTNYTINRVREVSLNKMETPAGDTDADNKMHGNYFGIYSIVNYLGALTSDVDFYNDLRTTDNTDTGTYGADPESYEITATAEALTNVAAANIQGVEIVNDKITAKTLSALNALRSYAGITIEGKQTYAEWKEAHHEERKRNNGNCHNQVALASGVYLELTTEQSTGTGLKEKDWGLITGVIELDLINVQPGIGGGFVYAKNEHGVRSESGNKSTTLTALNEGAVTQWDFSYATNDDNKKEWQTSGNFIHSTQTIIDDCYNKGSKYKGEDAVPAHYWFISGQVYIYDQYISAFTGSPNAYSETVDLPITINAASNGTMTLMDVKPNLYAFYATYTSDVSNVKLTKDQKLVINDVTYQLNDPISYWDWKKLPKSEQNLFVEDTYIIKQNCKIGNNEYEEGTVLNKNEYEALAYVGNELRDSVLIDEDKKAAFKDVFRSSNYISHDTGFILTYNVDNPSIWNQWYTKREDNPERLKVQEYTTDYEDGPTYHPITNGLYGRQSYAVSDIITKSVYDTYQKAVKDNGLIYPDSASFERAYVTKTYIEATNKAGTELHMQAKAGLAKSDYSTAEWSSISGNVALAYVCTNTIQLGETEFVYVNDLLTAEEKANIISRINSKITALPEITSADQTIEGLTEAQKTALGVNGIKTLTSLIELKADVNKFIVEAYYCTKAGLYGGDYYLANNNYRALNVWSSMSEEDRRKFTFNYDALDLLIDPAYGKYANGTLQKEGKKYQYDGKPYDYTVTDADKANMLYSLAKPIDYSATYKGDPEKDVDHEGVHAMKYTDKAGVEKYVNVGDELVRAQYETLPNEQRHYAAITVKAEDAVDGNYTYHVVKEDFVHIETPYAVGTIVDNDTYNKLTADEKLCITTLNFTSSEISNNGNDAQGNPNPLYYCRESYKVNENGMGESVTSIKGTGSGTTYNADDAVPLGAVISANDYGNLPNKQQNFTIHGVSPLETSTLYISKNADVNDLTKEKIITVIYKYDYEESDNTGLHITPVSERHIVNIHIKFRSGVPIVDDIQSPNIVLPGTSITMRVPTVQPGAYEVLGGGWEIFEKSSYAESHINGVEYKPSTDPLYWYQDGFLLAYYAKTYLGKTYSNAVPISVANYHDLKKVMDDKDNHLYVDYDRTRLKRNSKIYINNYTEGTEDGIDYLKDFYDLSHITEAGGNGYTVTGNKVSNAAEGANSHLVDHALLNISEDKGNNIYNDGETDTRGVKGGTNLEFILRTDINHTGTWTPIGSNDECFEGNLHGDGYTISGLDNSLFYNLCGNVYNLGVTGSFNTAGVVDKGTGYVESAWVKTTGTTALATKPNAVFGNPTDDKGYQVVNSYFWDGNNDLYNTTTTDNVTTSGGIRGKAKAMPEKAFYNGELAYNLNNFYLYKRYCDKKVSEGQGYEYYYYKKEDTGLSELQTGYYGKNEDLCSSGYIDNTSHGVQYVEDRYEDGDFRYASGSITLAENERCYIDEQDNNRKYWFPIWPDDYIFFGQALNYGYVEGLSHQNVPTAINRFDGRLDETSNSNRVYRAPAYYGSKSMSSAYFNKNAVFAQSKNGDAATIAYKGMTAIDFSGSNGDVAGGYDKGYKNTKFFPPLLDDDGLTGFKNINLTRNLLVYTPASGTTMTTTSKYLTEYVYDDMESTEGYRSVERKDDSYIHGHWIQQDGSGFVATRDQMLVDLNDFNAPMAYDFTSDKRMFYQRYPEDNEFVDLSMGWQGISIPFTAEMVTTNEKGEITHFYDGSETSKNDTGSKIGHEYWLRQYRDISGVSGDEAIRTARFTYPTKSDGDVMQKTTQYNAAVTNKFLWNYYYDGSHGQVDYHNDAYPGIYYSKAREYTDYPMLTAATPYLLGLPGKRYYEFDLSGKFEATTTALPYPNKLGKQTITFVSQKNTSIGVSDDELTDVTFNGYSFKPSYTTQTIAANANAYTLSATGASYDKVSTTLPTTVQPFRPYFAVEGNLAKEYKFETRSIRFTNDGIGDLNPDDDMGNGDTNGLEIYAKGRKIYTVSHLKENANIRIVNASGATLTTYVLEPGKKVITPITASGTYIVNKKKLYIK